MLPVIALSGYCTPADVVTVAKCGAIDFFWNAIAPDELLRTVKSALSAAQTFPGASTADHDRVRSETLHEETWSERCESLLEQVGASDVPVLPRGEAGVGSR
jgi:DNA-binding NtrC family response regulator